MRLDWRHAAGALLLALVAGLGGWRCTRALYPAQPTVTAPAGATPMTQTPPESERK